jgi:rubredoxin
MCFTGIAFNQTEANMEKWKCKICGYIYDPVQGDPDGNIPPNTPFERLPDDWACPLCGAPKDMFEKA